MIEEDTRSSLAFCQLLFQKPCYSILAITASCAILLHMESLLDHEILTEVVAERRVQNGERVKKRRTSLGLKQFELAAVAGIRPSSVCRIELGTFNPSEVHKIAIATALGMDVHELFVPLDRAEIMRRAVAA